MALFPVKLDQPFCRPDIHFQYIFFEIQHVVNWLHFFHQFCISAKRYIIHRQFYNIWQVVDVDIWKELYREHFLVENHSKLNILPLTRTSCEGFVRKPFSNLTVDTMHSYWVISLAFEIVQCRMLLRSRNITYRPFSYRPWYRHICQQKWEAEML